MLLEAYRRRRRAAMLSGMVLLALPNSLPPASAQDQAPANPPAQTPAPQESTPPSSSPPAPSVEAPATPAPRPQTSGGGTQLPQINVRAARRPPPRPVARRVAPTTRVPAATPTTVPPVSPAEVLTQRSNSFDQARSNLYT